MSGSSHDHDHARTRARVHQRAPNHAEDHAEGHADPHGDDHLDGKMLHKLQRETFGYFLRETNPLNGLVLDKTRKGSPCSIAATGLGLAAQAVGVERGFISRAQAIKRVLAALRFFCNSPQNGSPRATGYHGFYYHFIGMKTGRRVWKCELSTMDSALLLGGVLAAAAYFDGSAPEEREIRERADALYRRTEWTWAQNGGVAVSYGWRPEDGFIKYRWKGYDESQLLYVLGLGSPTYPLPEKSYQEWTSTFDWRRAYDREFLYAGPLFIHQLSQVWLDLRGMQDQYMRGKGIDYFENSRRATLIQQQYAVQNPKKFAEYAANCWGISASDGPGSVQRRVAGATLQFYDYMARGVPQGPDDGTLAPWAVVASLPFAPEVVIPAIHHLNRLRLREKHPYGFKAAFNPTFPVKGNPRHGWVSRWHFGINEGPIVLMIENYRTGMLWRLMERCPHIVTGLRRAGFRGGWLANKAEEKTEAKVASSPAPVRPSRVPA